MIEIYLVIVLILLSLGFAVLFLSKAIDEFNLYIFWKKKNTEPVNFVSSTSKEQAKNYQRNFRNRVLLFNILLVATCWTLAVSLYYLMILISKGV